MNVSTSTRTSLFSWLASSNRCTGDKARFYVYHPAMPTTTRYKIVKLVLSKPAGVDAFGFMLADTESSLESDVTKVGHLQFLRFNT